MNNTLAIIIPTKGRPQQIRELLSSIERQSVKPQWVIIVDGGSEALGPIESEFKGFPILSIRNAGDSSLTVQRNIGIRHVPVGMELVGFLDDDIILRDDALKNMFEFWKTASPDVGGACFHIVNEPPTAFPRIQEFFHTGSRTPGKVLRSGFTSKLVGFVNDTQVEWLCGGATVWRKNIFAEFQFDEAFRGYGHVEDLDFSYRVAKQYKLIAIAAAKAIHNSFANKHSSDFHLGIAQITNRFFFINKHREFSQCSFLLASMGTMAMNIALGCNSSQHFYFGRVLGNIEGLGMVLLRFFRSRF